MAATIALRKECVLRFTPKYLHIISASKNEPQIWAKIPKETFELYEVESIRDNIISLELNIEQLYQVLRNFEKSNSDQLAIRLQKTTNDHGKDYTRLALFFHDSLSASSTINHTFSIPVKLLRKDKDERLCEPEFTAIDLLMKLPTDIQFLFKRIERYKSLNLINIIGTVNGQLSVKIEKGVDSNVEIIWNELLQVNELPSSSEHTQDTFNAKVKLKYWNIASKFIEISKSILLIICQDEAVILQSFIDDSESCEIIYVINGIKD